MGELPPSSSSPESGCTGPFEDLEGHAIMEDASLEDEQIAGCAPDVVESDNDEPGKEEEASQGTANTVGLTELGSAGQPCFGPHKCLVRLATRVHGHAILRCPNHK
jgi:hypothetical protein